MWIQTTRGTFAIARLPEDGDTGMVHLLCNNYSDMIMLSDDYLKGTEPEECQTGAFTFSLRIPEAQAAALLSKLVAQVWYAELPQALETLHGSNTSESYRRADKMLYDLHPRYTDLDQPCFGAERVVLQSGVEGGDVSISVREEKGSRRYAVKLFDCTQGFLNKEDQVGPEIIEKVDEFSGWDDAITHLSVQPWWSFYPLHVDPEYRELVRSELRARGVDPLKSDWKTLLTVNEIDDKFSKGKK